MKDRPMDSSRRKAEVAAFKERKAAAGIYVVRCAASGERWVGRAPDLDTVWRRLTFELGLGGCRIATLQAAWRTHGAAAFRFDVLERIDEEIDYIRDKKLAARLAHWRAAIGG
jgi:hypothetical protein